MVHQRQYYLSRLAGSQEESFTLPMAWSFQLEMLFPAGNSTLQLLCVKECFLFSILNILPISIIRWPQVRALWEKEKCKQNMEIQNSYLSPLFFTKKLISAKYALSFNSGYKKDLSPTFLTQPFQNQDRQTVSSNSITSYTTTYTLLYP